MILNNKASVKWILVCILSMICIGVLSAQADKYAKKLDITMIGFNPVGFPCQGTNDLQKDIEKRYNVTLKLEKVDIFSTEQMNLYFAEGKMADFITLVANIEWRNLADQGLIRPISMDMLRKYAPTWMKKMDTLVGPDIVSSQTNFKGKVWGIPSTNYAQGAREINGIRGDWLDNLGVTKLPETIDDLYKIAKQFVNNDPDKNGKKDTYFMQAPQRAIFGAYGIIADVYYIDANKVKIASISDEYKEVLTLLAGWYKEGLIDPEFITDDTPKMKQKLKDGKFGFVSAHPWFFCETTQPDWNYSRMITEGNPKARFEFTPPIKGPKGKSGGWTPYPNIWATFGIFFGNKATDEKVIRSIQMKEDFATDWNWYLKCQYGEEGKYYKKDKDGVIVRIPEMNKPDTRVKMGLQHYSGQVDDWNDAKSFLTPGDLKYYQISMKYNPVYGAYQTPALAFSVSGINEAYKKYGAAMNTLVQEFYLNAITGKVNINNEWEAYKKKWLDSGGTQVIDEYQKLYEKSLAK